MDVINEIIQNSAMGAMSKGYRKLVLLVFSTIVSVLFTMLFVIISKGSELTIHFGY